MFNVGIERLIDLRVPIRPCFLKQDDDLYISRQLLKPLGHAGVVCVLVFHIIPDTLEDNDGVVLCIPSNPIRQPISHKFEVAAELLDDILGLERSLSLPRKFEADNVPQTPSQTRRRDCAL